MVASVALVYEPLRIAVPPEVIVGVLVVSEHVGAIGLVTVTVTGHTAGVVHDKPFTVSIYIVVTIGCTAILELLRVG